MPAELAEAIKREICGEFSRVFCVKIPRPQCKSSSNSLYKLL